LSPGTYTVTVTDTNGCTGTTEVVVAPGAPTVSITTTGTDPSTPMGMDGSVTANATFGTAPYTYSWSNGETTPTITGLSAGCYTVTVTDANNCSAESTTCIEDPMSPPTVTTTTTPTSGY